MIAASELPVRQDIMQGGRLRDAGNPVLSRAEPRLQWPGPRPSERDQYSQQVIGNVSNLMSNLIPGLTLGVRRQMEIYQEGIAGKTPEQPVSLEALDRKARSVLDRAGLRLRGRRCRFGRYGACQPRGISPLADRAALPPRRESSRPGRRSPGHAARRAVHAGADRRPVDHPSRCRSCRGACSPLAGRAT